MLLDGQSFAELYCDDDASGGMYPQILVGDLGGDGQVNVVAGSWNAESIYHYSFDAADVSAWSALGGEVLTTVVGSSWCVRTFAPVHKPRSVAAPPLETVSSSDPM